MSFFEIQTRTAWGQTLAQFADWCAPQPGWQTLDVGCGPGLLPALLAERGCRAQGIDPDGPALQQGQAYFTAPQLGLAQALGQALPFPTAAFDLVSAVNVLFLLPDALPVLHEIRRVLYPGGWLCLLNPSEQMSVAAATVLADRRGLTGLGRESLLTWAARAEAHNRWDEPTLAVLLSAAGLRPIESVLKIGPGLARWTRAERVG